jgi:hypothetical protein
MCCVVNALNRLMIISERKKNRQKDREGTRLDELSSEPTRKNVQKLPILLNIIYLNINVYIFYFYNMC